MIHNGKLDDGRVIVCHDKAHLKRKFEEIIEKQGTLPRHTIFARKRFEVEIKEVDEV
jgi:hypothetical protein